MKTLLILRHGKASTDFSYRDYDRPLKDRGRRNAQQMGRWIGDEIGVPDLILASSAERARQTAELAAEAMGYPLSGIDYRRELYLATAGEIMQTLATLSDKVNRLLLVGHNPGLEDLLEWLSGEYSHTGPDGKLLPTAALGHLSFDVNHWQLGQASGRVQQVLRARSLDVD